jgi:hypothetical protein
MTESMGHSGSLRRVAVHAGMVGWCGLVWCGGGALVGSATAQTAAQARTGAASRLADTEDSEFARKYELLQSREWRQAIAEFSSWLTTQSVYTPTEVRRIKLQFNDRVAGMSSYELEYLLDSISAKVQLLATPEARDAKAWLGEYLSAMSDARRARELQNVPNILDMSAAQLWQEIQRIDTMRGTLRQRQQGVESRQSALATRASSGRQATSSASRDAAARLRSAPAHSPYRSGGGTPPFSDIQPRRSSIGVGPMGAFVTF